MTIVLDLDRFEQRVRLRSAGFESCVVTPPEFVAELRLAGHYRHPWRTRASVFVDELLTLTVEPALTAAQARTLPGDDRARLRRAVVATYGCERDWRALYGSHLSADERLLAVMYWQWRNRQVSVRRMTGAHRAQANSLAGELIPSVSVPTDLAARMAAAADISAVAASTQALVPGGIAANFDLDELVSPAALGAVKALEMQKRVASDIAKRFELPSLKAFEHITKLTQTMKAFDNLRALSKTSVIGGISNLGGINNLGAFARTGMDTSVAAAITGEWGGNLRKLMGVEKPFAWQAPTGLASLMADWNKNASVTQALVGLSFQSPAVALWPDHMSAATKALQSFQLLTEPLREFSEAMEVVDRFERRWQNEALYFIISGFLAVCSVWEMHELAALDRAGVEAAVLLALEAVVGDRAFIPALREQISRAPYLNEYQRVNLDHALEHAAGGEYMKACAGLYVGLEGAFWEAGYAHAVVTLERKDARNNKRDVGSSAACTAPSATPTGTAASRPMLAGRCCWVSLLLPVGLRSSPASKR